MNFSRLFAASITLLLLIALALDCSSRRLYAAVLDDSELFVEAFNAYQKKDYLLAIEKAKLITENFPDTPLRDISFLLIARSGLKSGDNELAASAANRFNEEFPSSTLKASVEDELLHLVSRMKKGEQLLPDRNLQMAARKVRDDQLALERAAALKAEQLRLAREKAERERVALARAEEERRERERIAAEKLARESIKLAIILPAQPLTTAAGENAGFPADFLNSGSGSNEFLVSVESAPEYRVRIASATNPGRQLERITVAPGEKSSAIVSFTIPAGKVDGQKANFIIKAVSSRYSDISFTGSFRAVAAAPLIRAVIRPDMAKASQGQLLEYRISVLNAGSLASGELALRLTLPGQLEFVSAGNSDFRRDSDGSLRFKLAKVESGAVSDIRFKAKVRDSAPKNESLRCKAEITDSSSNIPETFNSAAVVVQ